jgi:hypothetical protein
MVHMLEGNLGAYCRCREIPRRPRCNLQSLGVIPPPPSHEKEETRRATKQLLQG